MEAQAGRNSSIRMRYIRYNDHVSTNLMRWLHSDRDVLHSNFVRGCIRDSTTQRLDPEDPGLHSLVWRRVLPPGADSLTFPQTATHFNVFRFSSNWYLVPESPADVLTPLESQFWTLHSRTSLNNWTQQGEELTSFTFAAPGPDDAPATPFYHIRLGAVGPLLPSKDATYILRSPALDNELQRWPGVAWERNVVFGDLIPFGRFTADYVRASKGMPPLRSRGVEVLHTYLREKYKRAGAPGEGEVTGEEDVIPGAVERRVRMIVGSIRLDEQ